MKKPKRLIPSIIKRQKFDLDYDMKLVHLCVADKQEKIARAKRAGEMELAIQLGKELTISEYGRVVAVQTVSSNIGARSPGLSKEKFATNDDYERMVRRLGEIVSDPASYEATPLDRIYIPKKDGTKRPLSIPSYTDRCLQSLYKLALEPIGEEHADLSSYGFRPIRGTTWAAGRIISALANPLTKYGYVVEVDIKSCFDKINHNFLASIIPTIPKEILSAWLKCGYVERSEENYWINPTDEGVPQGGILSPLLTNFVLDGLEEFIRQKISNAKTGSIGQTFCRYADDMVVLVTTEKNAILALEAIKEFLAIRGLEIKEAKTRITDLDKSDFEFLGYKFGRVYRRNNKRKTAKIGIPTSAITNLRNKVTTILKTGEYLHNKINKINSVCRGWANYYRFTHTSIYTFRALRYWLWKQIYKACYRMTSHQYDKANHTEIHKIIMLKYFRPYGTYTSWPVIIDNKGVLHSLFDISSVDYIAPKYTNKARNAFITEDREVLDAISLKNKSSHRQTVISNWFGRCGLCSKCLEINPIPYELHHILPKRFGGKDTPKNLVPLCKSPCHKLVSSAIIGRDINKILEYISLGILEVPYSFLESITPLTE